MKIYFKIKIDGYIYEIPNYLILKKYQIIFQKTNSQISLFFKTSDANKFFIPNNLLFPKARIILENYFNEI